MAIAAIKLNTASKIFYINYNNRLNELDFVIVNTQRGKEIATVVKTNVEIAEKDFAQQFVQFDRLASQDDVKKWTQLQEKSRESFEIARNIVDKFALNMKLVDAEYTLDGTKIIISFVCEERVDFRELVKELAAQLKTRIELKQIGLRDQAKLVGGIGSCGQECCCSKFLNEFDKVSLKMAKTQNLSLNPTKISGICGRLMCCLSYENTHYSAVLSKMPKINARVVTPSGAGVVIYNNLLREKCTVKLDGDDVKVADFNLTDITFEKHATFAKQLNDNNLKAETCNDDGKAAAL